MKLYYTLACVILPATMMAACSGSGSKKSEDNSNLAINTPVTTQVEQLPESKPLIPLTETIDSAAVTDTHQATPETEPTPLSQTDTADIQIDSKPGRRIYQFGFNRQEMDEASQSSLQQHADYLLAHPDATLEVKGHSDTQGNQAYNLFLSTERAKKVARFLIDQGVAEEQLKVKGLGDSQPLNDVNSFKENRRVELEYSDSRVAAN